MTVGIPLRKLTRDTARRVLDAGIHVTNVLGYGPELHDRSTWSPFADSLNAACAFAEEVGADAVVTTTGSAGAMPWESAADAFGSLLQTVRPRSSVPLLIEHTNQLRTDISFVHRLRDAVDLARLCGTGVVMETNACWGERALGVTIAQSQDVIKLVQVSDASGRSLSTPDRLVPGDGVIPFERIFSQLFAAGYGGYFELEYAGPQIERLGYGNALARALPALADLLQRAQEHVLNDPGASGPLRHEVPS